MPLSKTRLTITIDGPAGAGKSTMARLLAEKVGYLYLDTGAMYRAITLKAMKEKVDFRDEEALVKLARQARIDLKFKPHFKVFLDHRDVSREIRTPEVTANVHYLANLLGVRKVMWRLQRLIGKDGGVVAEGRDTGTIVFPKADIKFYLEAGSGERARRRQKDFKALKRTVGLKKLEKEIRARDKKDRGREIAPLKKAGEAIVIDTTELSIEQVLEEMLRCIYSETKSAKRGLMSLSKTLYRRAGMVSPKGTSEPRHPGVVTRAGASQAFLRKTKSERS